MSLVIYWVACCHCAFSLQRKADVQEFSQSRVVLNEKSTTPAIEVLSNSDASHERHLFELVFCYVKWWIWLTFGSRCHSIVQSIT